MANIKYETPEQIAEGIYRGDKEAETELFNRCHRPITRILERKTMNQEEAKDLCQEALCIAIVRLRKAPLSDPGGLDGYVRKTAINLDIAHKRKASRRKTHNNLNLLQRIVDPTQNQLRTISRERTNSAVQLLLASMTNTRDRLILLRVFIEENDKNDICAELGLSARHFDRVLFRAKQRFKELLIIR